MGKPMTEEEKRKNREYSRKWREENREKDKERKRKYRRDNPDYERKHNIKERFGSLERYREASMKYDGECAFACGRKVGLIHHLDGKSTWNSPRTEVNNNLSNLLPLCFSCHSWLHNRKINKTKVRRARKEVI